MTIRCAHCGYRPWSHIDATKHARECKEGTRLHYEGQARIAVDGPGAAGWQGKRNYPAPNGGKRILPGWYAQLREAWVKSNDGIVLPEDMNTGHLTNTLLLLHESHGNTVDRASELLGRIASHFRNRPDVVHLLAQAAELIQTSAPHEVYPVMLALDEELCSRDDPTELMEAAPDLLNWHMSDGDIPFSAGR